MGRLIGSERPGRLLVLVTGAFAMTHLFGLVLWSGFGEGAGMDGRDLAFALLACLVWVFLGLLVMDRPGRGKDRLSRFLSRGRVGEGVVFSFLAVGWVAVALAMISWNDEKSNVLAAEFLFQNGIWAYFQNYAEINSWLGPHHPPLLPLIYAGLYAVFSPAVLVGRVFAVLCSLSAAAVGFVWLKRRFGRETALVALALLPAMPLVLFNGASSILDAPFWLVFSLGLLTFDRYLDSGRARDAALCGFVVAVAVLSRYNGLLLPVIFFGALLIQREDRGALKEAKTWLILGVPAALLLPWVAVAASSGTLLVQARRIASFFLIAVVPDGGSFYLEQYMLPLVPLMIGLWNPPMWIGGVYSLWKKWGDPASRRLVLYGVIYVLLLLASLPNPRYLLSISTVLAAFSAVGVLNVEKKEGRGAELLVYLLGLSFLYVFLILRQTSLGSVYLFY